MKVSRVWIEGCNRVEMKPGQVAKGSVTTLYQIETKVVQFEV